jgi:hypothetical protein
LPLAEVKVLWQPPALPLLPFAGSSWCKNREVYFTLSAISMGQLLNAELLQQGRQFSIFLYYLL